MYILDDPIVRCWGNIWGNRQQGSGMPSLPRLSAPHRRALDLTDERSGRARPAPPAGDRSRSLSAGTAARSACAVAGTVIAAETGHGAIRKTPPPPGWVQIEPIANGEGTDLAQFCARARFAARADAGPCARVGSARDREPDSPLRAYWSVYELTHRTPGSRRAAGSRSTRTECPNLLAHYFCLWGTTVVWQDIDR